jgi:hypothetical protein
MASTRSDAAEQGLKAVLHTFVCRAWFRTKLMTLNPRP